MPREVARPGAVAVTPSTMLNDLPGASRKPCTGWRSFHVDGRPAYFGGQSPGAPMTRSPGTA